MPTINELTQKNITCCVSGHRNLKYDLNIKHLKEIFIALIDKKGINRFMIGMAVGFDMLCFKILLEIRKKRDIKLIACVPCEGQDLKYFPKQKELYREYLSLADEVKLISKTYTPYCMIKRNMYMVDNSCFLITYLREEKGGTFNTYNYAKEHGVAIVRV